MAELSKLLAFMFKEDKEDILAQYNKMLDEADDVRYGINPEVRQDFSAFRQLLEDSGGNVSAIPERFYSTYWFYSFTQSKAHRQ